MKKTLSFVLACVMLFGCIFTLTSCFFGPSNDPTKAKESLSDAGYHVELIDNKIAIGLMSLGVEGLEAVVAGVNEDDLTDAITIFYFEDKDAAAEAFESIKEYVEKDNDKESEYEIKQSGAMIWAGSKAAVKAAR